MNLPLATLWTDYPLFPQRASTLGEKVDNVYYFLVAVGVFFSALIFLLIFVFALRYRRRSDSELPPMLYGSTTLELAWSILPMFLLVGIFWWGASVFFENARPPSDTLDIYVVAKQWMWKLQHPEGQMEINALHVPVGRPVKLIMTSEDVIHSFFVPVFREKKDVLPGRYTTLWFQATKTGTFHLFCAEYCGTNHSHMIGWVTVMDPTDYQNWLGGGVGRESLEVQGQKLFDRLGCSSCHLMAGNGRCPSLVGLFGSTVKLSDGSTAVADEAYLRESILVPGAKIVAGYQPIMPTFTGQVDEQGVLALIAYVKSLKTPAVREVTQP